MSMLLIENNLNFRDIWRNVLTIIINQNAQEVKIWTPFNKTKPCAIFRHYYFLTIIIIRMVQLYRPSHCHWNLKATSHRKWGWGQVSNNIVLFDLCMLYTSQQHNLVTWLLNNRRSLGRGAVYSGVLACKCMNWNIFPVGIVLYGSKI